MTVMSKTLNTAFALLTTGLVLSAPLPALAEDQSFVPSGLLVEDGAQTLPIAPTKVIALDAFAIVMGSAGDDHQILQLDATTLDPIAAQSLPFVPDDMIVSAKADLLYVIGTQDDGTTRVLVFADGLKQISEVIAPILVAHPTLSLATGERLVVGGLPTRNAQGALLAFDMSDPTAPTLIENLLPDTYNLFGIKGAWLDDTAEPTLFLNTGRLPTLVAVGIGGKGVTEYADISFVDDSRNQEPLTAQAFMPSQLCKNGEDQAAFLLSSNVNQDLFLAMYDPDFKSLDVLARTQFNLRLPAKRDTVTYDGSEVLVPTSLLASACDLGVVWISDLRAREIEQFAVNPSFLSLEKVGEIALSSSPNGLSISDSGRSGFAISTDARTITRFHSGSGEVSGTGDARLLQRLLTERGFPVGAIDGQIGAKTLSAVERFEDRNSVTLDIRGDLPGALETIQNVPSLQKK